MKVNLPYSHHQQGAYNRVSGDGIYNNLSSMGMSDGHCTAFKSCWEENGEGYMDKLKKITLGAPQVLSDVSWQLQLQLAQDNSTKLTTPCAVFEFKTSNPSSYANNETDVFQAEFTHDELYNFFQKIEKIQSQIDKLGY